jgi:hypothetical protein
MRCRNRGACALSANEITQPLRPATNRLARIRTWTSEVGARCALQLHHVPIESGRPASNRRLRIGGPVLFPIELRPRKEPPAGVEPAPRPYKGRVLAVDTTEAKVEPEGFEPSSFPRSFGGLYGEQPNYQEPAAGALCPTRAAAPQWRRRESNPLLPRCKRGALPPELRPHVLRGRTSARRRNVLPSSLCSSASITA